jgi:serine protease Do
MRSLALSKSRSAWTALILAGGALAGFLAAGLGEAQDQAAAPVPAFAGPPSFADVIEEVSPAVVNIAVTKERAVSVSSSPFSGSPLEEFFGPFFGIPEGALPEQRRMRPQLPPVRGQGSGFVIDADGYIATNHHVVEGASEVTVTLATGEQLAATVVGTDPDTDLALLKVDNGGDLPALRLGDSDRARVGEWVVAIGNPFGLGGSASAGIISARGRDIQSGPYDDFLQIDAPINSGNSGGPVFNAAGEVIGINTAIFSPNGGNIGIGFAIPANQARRVLDVLREGGTVSRGWLGITMQPVDESLAEAFELGRPRGALVAEVQPDSPADAGGIVAGDVITRLDGREIDSTRTLGRLVGALDAGERVEIDVWRDGQSLSLVVEVGDRGEGLAQAGLTQGQGRGQGPGARSGATLGLTLEDLTPERRTSLGLGPDVQGAVVTAVAPNSPAARQGIQVGDVIQSVNRRPTATADEAASSLASVTERGGRVLVRLHRDGSSRFVAVNPA